MTKSTLEEAIETLYHRNENLCWNRFFCLCRSHWNADETFHWLNSWWKNQRYRSQIFKNKPCRQLNTTNSGKKNLTNTEIPTPETDRSFDDNGVCGRCADSRGSIGRGNRVGHDVLLSNQFNTATNLALSEITPTLGGRLVLVINLFSYLNKWRKLKRYWIDEKRRNIANCEKASRKSGLLRSIYLIDDAGSQESWTSICKRFHFLLFLNYIFLLHEQHRLVQNSIDSTTKSTEGRVDGYNKHITQLIF